MPILRRDRLALVGLALAALCACDTGTEPQEAVHILPLSVGNSWTYAPDNLFLGDTIRWSVTEQRGDTVVLVRPWPGGLHGSVTVLDRSPALDLLLESGEFGPYYRFAADTSWVHRDPWECDDGAEMLVVTERDPVVTPAGTFDRCLRVERRSTASCDDAGTMLEWWAPEVGLVRWEELNYLAGGTIRYDLVDYDVVP